MKKFMTLLTIFVLALILVACESEDLEEHTDTVLTTTQMQDDPMSFTGQISVEGVVGNQGRFNFSISDGEGTFELAVDYRGNQSLPTLGTVIVVTGQMNYRSCCGPHIVSTRFEVTE